MYWNNNNMPTCITCKRHYFLSPFNETKQCDNCLDVLSDIDELDAVEIDCVVNGAARRIRPNIQDDNDTDSFSS